MICLLRLHNAIPGVVFKLGFVGLFDYTFGGAATMAPSGRGLPRSGWRSPAARTIKARKIAVFSDIQK